jgi:sulfonate transport system ATP-binding protein
LERVGLSTHADDWPTILSGGQQQRVALARALLSRPPLLLLDEPLGALDALTRMEMQQLILQLWQEHRFTALLVTHDVEEAVAMADRVILLRNGRVALNAPIPLPHPRQRSQPEFAQFVGEILSEVMNPAPFAHQSLQRKDEPDELHQSEREIFSGQETDEIARSLTARTIFDRIHFK